MINKPIVLLLMLLLVGGIICPAIATDAASVHRELNSDPELFSIDELNWLSSNNSIIAAYRLRRPFAFNNNGPQGIAIDYADLLSEITGIEFVYGNDTNVANNLNEMKNGEGADIVINIAETAARSEYLYFTRPWFEMRFALFLSEGSAGLFLDSLADLQGKTIAVETDSFAYSVISAAETNIKVVKVNSPLEGLQAVSNGEVFGWIGDHPVGLYTLKYNNIGNVKVAASIKELGTHKISIGVRKDRKVLYDIICKAMTEVSQARIDSISLKYVDAVKYRPNISVKTVVILTAVTAFVFILILTSIIVKIKNSNSTLNEAENFLRIAFQSVGDGIVVTDSLGMIVRVNSEALKILNMQLSSVIGFPVDQILDIVDAQTLTGSKKPIARVLEQGRVLHEDSAAFFTVDGRRYYISYSVAPVMSKSGSLDGAVFHFRDITDRYETKRRMQRTQIECDMILDNINVGVCFYDSNMYPVKYNNHMMKICNERVLKFKELFESDNFACVELPQTRQKMNITSVNEFGKNVELEITSNPVIEEGKVVGVVEIAVDISQLSELERKRTLAYEKLKAYSGNLEIQVSIRTFELQDRNDQLDLALAELKAAQGKMILSEKMAALGQLINGIAHEINTPLGVVSAASSAINSNVKKVISEIAEIDCLRTGELSGLINDLIVKGVEYRNGITILSTREERNVRRAIQDGLVEQGICSDTEYIASMVTSMGAAGDWKNYLPILQREDNLDILARLNSILNICASGATIRQAVTNASKVVLALKSYVHKSNYGQGDVQYSHVFDIVSGLQTVLILFESRIKNKIDLKVEYNEVPQVKGYSDELNQVWTNLIQNAIQAMPYGGELFVSVYAEDGGVCVEIADTGCGMSQDVMDKMFEPMFTTKSSGEGSGIGLDIVKRIIEDHHSGAITVDSKENEGTAIKVWLPEAEL